MRLSEARAFIDLQSLLSLKVWRRDLDRELCGNWAEERGRPDGMDFALVCTRSKCAVENGWSFPSGKADVCVKS